jgi:ATP-dependent DNA helicase
MDLQAQDRVHRIGQTKPVLIFRLSTVNTAEDRMLQRAASKRKLERLVIHKSTLRLGELILLERFKGRQQLLTDEKLLKEELEEILRGDDEQTRLDGQQGTELDKNELEMILDRSETALNRTDITAKSIRLVATG